jgi:purine-nucleoside phosphorylase
MSSSRNQASKPARPACTDHLPSPESTADLLRRGAPFQPALAMVLGSGMQHLAAHVEVLSTHPYRSLPGFPPPTVPGHQCQLLFARFAGVPVLLLCGRSHYYEGWSCHEITFPIRVLAALGVEALLLTNAAGGIHPKLHPGDLMCLTDHINAMGVNPLRGSAPLAGNGFVDLTRVYDRGLIQLLRQAARRSQVRLRSGVYLAVSGPSYETPAEIRAFARAGADAIGMSTVPEAIVARQCGLRVAALSCVTNLAAGRSAHCLSHKDVLRTGQAAEAKIFALLREFVPACAKSLAEPGSAKPASDAPPPRLRA